MRTYRGRPRRGVLLLVILAMLAMFGLVALTFVMITGHEMRSSRAIQRMGQHQTRPREDLHQALLQAARGSDNPASVMGPHSLLEDIYGRSVLGQLTAAPTPRCGGQLLEFSDFSDLRLLGSVLTMRTGPAAGQSTHLVGIGYPGGLPALQAVAFQGAVPAAGDQYVINGTPFSGTGFGFDGSAITPLALRPNDPLNDAPAGGANEDYDAVDFQNMLLAMVDPDSGQTVIPSLHRPALVNYWFHRLFNSPMLSLYSEEERWYAILQPYGLDCVPDNGDEQWPFDPATAKTIVDVKRQIILRPLPEDHPDFDGSNPSSRWLSNPPFNSGTSQVNPYWERGDYGFWDVDNDGDGVPDGIWVDLGMAVRSTADGRLYKPLFSLLCVDLDGRLNVNAHGCQAQAEAAYYALATVGGGFTFAGDTQVAPLPRGQGYGPAEVNLRFLCSDLAEYGNLLAGRYGAPAVAGVPGVPGDDPLSWNKWFEYRHRSMGFFWGFVSDPATYQPDAYGTPPNRLATGAVGLDMAGRPIHWGMAVVDEQVDDPYEFDLSPARARGLTGPGPDLIDNAFSVAEWERLARPFDRDAGRLPNRLGVLAPSLVDRRHVITTDSWDLPCPGVVLSKQVRELLRAKGVPEAAWKDLLPPEVLAGQRMNLNRLLGDGRDNNANGVVDDPLEAATGETVPVVGAAGAAVVPPVAFDHANDGPTAPNLTDYYTTRQLHARHIYVLLMLLADRDYYLNNGMTNEEVARAFAQWAVNVVDFYDRDSIMTPFPFDSNPFDGGGWSPPPGDPRYVVWGCERPELLITETLAWHDRRTEDTAGEEWDGTGPEEEAGKVDEGDAKKNDKDFDQKERPRGALFIELYNPWTAMEPPPGEFWRDPATGWARGVRLNQTTPGGHPVWRLIIVEREEDPENPGEHADPDDPIPDNRPDIKRSVYFMDLSDAGGFDDPQDGRSYYPNMSAEFAPVMPGRYAVVGPGEPGAAGPEYTTYVGDKVAPDPSTTRRIVLEPEVDTSTMQVEVLNNKGAGTDLPTGQIQPAAAVVINQPRRLSISEPTDGYVDTKQGQTYNPATGEYEPKPLDVPLDADSPLVAELLMTGTTPNVRVVHLQRLANPLMPWNATTNPYLTIDSMPIDLTAFNGITSPGDYPGGTVMFEARQRGDTSDAAGTYNLWKQEAPAKPLSASGGAITDHYFNELLSHTLGYLNEPLGNPNPAGGLYKGDPQQPFPWLTWNNRPFVSHLELLLVPALRSSKLLVRNGNTPAKYFGIVKPSDDPRPYTPAAAPQHAPYPHLLNFFHSAQSDPAGNSPQLHRLLEYVHVPSRFVGTELQGNPAFFVGGSHSFHPPFNRISRYREPGRINLNTIFEYDVFRGLMNNFPGMSDQAFWSKFVESRRGYAGADMLALDSAYPSRFARPFRSFAGAEMVPLAATMEPAREINATLLRSDAPLASDMASKRPLFVFDTVGAAAAIGPFNDPDRNPYFRYQGLQRLGNLVTTRSNVYAIWITVGYFEVDAVPGYDPNVYPDGYRLGPELGSETGEVKRHRAFYVFDRSIPVGFRRGQDYNVENAVLVGRFIE